MNVFFSHLLLSQKICIDNFSKCILLIESFEQLIFSTIECISFSVQHEEIRSLISNSNLMASLLMLDQNDL